MTNRELFERYNTKKWIIEQNLCFLLQEYWDKHCKDEFHSRMPENPVSFVKKFMKEETICDIKCVDENDENIVEDVDFIELT